MADGNSSPIDLGLPETPLLSKEISIEIYDQFAAVFNAIKILRQKFDEYTGNGVLDPTNYLSSVNPSFSQSIQVQKLIPIIVTSSTAITAGQFINLFNSAGLKARPAQANSGLANKAYGWAPADIPNGTAGIVFLQMGILTNLAGLTVGAIYYLSSTTPGGITTIRPTAAGTISQEVGIALSVTELFVRLSPYQVVN